MQTITRSMGVRESTVAMALYVQVSFLLGSLALGALLGDGRFAASGGPASDFLLRPWVVPPLRDLALIAFTGVTIGLGGYLVSHAYRLSPAGVVAPFEYAALILALTWGFVIWGDIPGQIQIVGIGLVLISGIVVALRGARAGAARPSATRIVTRR